MIRSSTLSLKFANLGKRDELTAIVEEFRRVGSLIMDEIWTWEKVPVLIKHKQFSYIETYLSARMMQVLLKQCSAIVRGTKASAKGKIVSKPDCSGLNLELDERFIKFQVDEKNKTSFDIILVLGSLTKNRTKIILPLKRTKHWNKLAAKGTQRKGCRITKKGITFAFSSEPESSKGTETLGIDIGISDVIATSKGHRTQEDIHGWSLSKVLERLSRRKKGSKGFSRAQTHRNNFINWSVNQLDISNVSEIKLEQIKNMRKGKQCDRLRSHWTYTKIFDKIKQKAEEHGVRVLYVNPAYTSQKCSSCGTVDKKSRVGKEFNCVRCGFTFDSDLNAALNIERSKPLASKRGIYSSSCKENNNYIISNHQHLSSQCLVPSLSSLAA